jgi:L-alanine-DL-glutamate epimerase-like enolase superfamily enzyme
MLVLKRVPLDNDGALCQAVSMTFQIEAIHFHVLPMRTRFPFKYGIASMSALPHLFVSADLVVNGGKPVRGMASEGLPPKWFTKNPTTLFETDLAEMLAVIQNAARISRLAASQQVGFFRWWQAMYEEQGTWAKHTQTPGLLAFFGTSLMERAVLDGLCQAAGLPLHKLLRTDMLGIDLGEVRSETRGMTPADVVLEQPLSSVYARHTVGLGDPLDDADAAAAPVDDGLPYTLIESIRSYGLKWFKLKLSGQAEADVARLKRITAILETECAGEYQCTLDGNEQYHELGHFCEFYEQVRADAVLERLMKKVVLIEQPLFRAEALTDEVKQVLESRPELPPMIIDESDGSLEDLPRALELGYRGTSHKNCKGIVKGIANAALLKRQPGLTMLSGEDLASIGPVAMVKDIAVAAALGITHVERNGHHYFKGLSVYPDEVQRQVEAAHPDLYERRPGETFARLKISAGRLQLGSVNAAPFGNTAALDGTRYEPLAAWIKRGGMGEL